MWLMVRGGLLTRNAEVEKLFTSFLCNDTLASSKKNGPAFFSAARVLRFSTNGFVGGVLLRHARARVKLLEWFGDDATPHRMLGVLLAFLLREPNARVAERVQRFETS